MNTILGTGNNLLHYAVVLLLYGLMYLLVRYPKPGLELNSRANFRFLCLFWGILMFVGNYFFYRLGLMSFLPWLNNLVHSFIWVGICLSWLYYTTQERPLLEQIILFAFTSFIIKMAEHMILGTWSREHYLGIYNPYAYIIAMSVVDGFYPIISQWLIKQLSKKSTLGIYAPRVA